MSRVYDALERAGARIDAGGPAATATPSAADLDFAVESPPDRPAAEPAAPPGVQPAALSTFHRIAAEYEGKTVLDVTIDAVSREQYRRLAASLHQAQAASGMKVVMVTSAVVGEGKTLTASNIALTLSHSYQKQVLLIDADLRRPSVQAVFGLPAGSGLAEGLASAESVPLPVHQVSPRLGILAAGRPTSDPIAALTSERMRRLVGDARRVFDWVILDTPPVALLTDAKLVSAMTDGVVVVVRAAYTPWDLVDRAVQAIGRERTFGIVLNRAALPAHRAGYYADYYQYYAASSDSSE